MDAYAISYTSPSRRNSSRIYQDLKTIRLNSIAALEAEQLRQILSETSQSIMRIHSDKGKKPNVGIIGAGFAGLRCADMLLQYGFRVTILEARNRLGGRVHQHTLPNGHVVDSGPNWIHGTDDNPILDIAKQTKTAVGSWDTRSYVFDENGQLLSLEEGERLSTVMWNIMEAAFKHSNKNSAAIDAEESLLDYFKQHVSDHIPDGFERQRRIVLQMADLWGSFVGSPITKQSLKFYWLEECLDGENLFCAGTYAKILNAVARPAVEGASIAFEAVAEKITTKPTEDPGVEVRTQDGDTFLFDELVVTTPLGWLQKNKGAFDPPLPDRLNQSIDNIGYGCLEKVYISFPKAFWLVPDAEGRKVQGFCQWLAPIYAADTNPKRWTHEVMELGGLSPSTAHPTLLFYIYGDESIQLTNAAARFKSKESRDTFYYDFLRPYYSRLPGYNAALSDCQPTGCYATDWLHDGFAGNGSYSNFQVGLREGDEDVRILREGVPDRKVWFAGEHTAPFVALGTATGAYWSGESVGRRIAEAYGFEKVSKGKVG